MITFSSNDPETHKVLCTPSTHFIWAPFVMHRTSRQDTSHCHVRLSMFASTSAHAAVIQERRSCRFATLVLSITSLTNPHRKWNQGGLGLVIVGARQLVRLGQSNDLQKFLSGRLKRLRPNEGEHCPVEKWYRVAGLQSVGRQILPTCSCKLLRSLCPPQRKTDPPSGRGVGHSTHWPLDCRICVQWPCGVF